MSKKKSSTWIGLLFFVSVSCDSNLKKDLAQPKRIERYVHFSDSAKKDHFIAAYVKMRNGQPGLEVEIRNFKDSVLFKTTWTLIYEISVANKNNIFLTEKERAEQLANSIQQSLGPDKFAKMSDFVVTRIFDDPDNTLKHELERANQRPVFTPLNQIGVVYSVSLGRIVEIQGFKKKLLDKYAVPY